MLPNIPRMMGWRQGVKRRICVATSLTTWKWDRERRKEEEKIGARAIDHLSKAALGQLGAQSPPEMFRRRPTSEEWWWRNEGKSRGRCFWRLWVKVLAGLNHATTTLHSSGCHDGPEHARMELQEDCVLIVDDAVSSCCQYRLANRGIEHNRAGVGKSFVQAMSQSGTYPPTSANGD